MEAAGNEEQDGLSVHSPGQAPPSSASSLSKEHSQVDLELKILEALEIYPPSKLQGPNMAGYVARICANGSEPESVTYGLKVRVDSSLICIGYGPTQIKQQMQTQTQTSANPGTTNPNLCESVTIQIQTCSNPGVADLNLLELGVHRHFVLYGLMEFLWKSFDRHFSADEILQLLDRFFNLEMLKPDDEETDTLNQEEDFSLPQHFFIKSHDLA